VALLSELKIRRSEFSVELRPTTSGPPFKPVPLMYSLTPALSKTSGVLSKVLRPEVLMSY
jgi:hypothetical protein